MKIVIAGADGQLGQELKRANWGARCRLEAFDRLELDITDPVAVSRSLTDAGLLVNAAAYTQVDAAEGEPSLAFAVNADAPGLLAAACAERKIPIIHISTDYIFDNSERRPIDEEAIPNPINLYGRSKLAGEAAVRAANDKHLILRAGWLYAAQGKNFLSTMLRLATESSEIEIVDDQTGIPTPAADLAAAIAHIVGSWGWEVEPVVGTFHYACRGETTWYGFAQEIFSVAAEFRQFNPNLKAISSADYPTAAKRPGYSVLDCSRIDRVYEPHRRHWQEGVRAVVSELLS